MLTPEQFVRALALTESNDNPEAWGDAGRAMGRFQVHPDWVATWSKHYDIEPRVGETWDRCITRLVTAFANDHLSKMQPEEVAMYFHLGHLNWLNRGDFDTDYQDRFRACAHKVANA